MENPSINGWFGGTPISGNLHILEQVHVLSGIQFSFLQKKMGRSQLSKLEFTYPKRPGCHGVPDILWIASRKNLRIIPTIWFYLTCILTISINLWHILYSDVPSEIHMFEILSDTFTYIYIFTHTYYNVYIYIYIHVCVLQLYVTGILSGVLCSGPVRHGRRREGRHKINRPLAAGGKYHLMILMAWTYLPGSTST